MPSLTLQDLSEIESGYDFRSRIKDDPAGYYRVIQAKDIRDDLTLDTEGLSTVAVPERARLDSKLARGGDVLLTTKGEHIYATHVDVDLGPTIIQSTFAILRVKDANELLPRFLALQLNHAPMQADLKRLQKGTSIAYMRIDDLRGLIIPTPPPMARQKAILGLYEASLREAQLHRQLESARHRLLDGLLSESSDRT